jgi:hypothetical protein
MLSQLLENALPAKLRQYWAAPDVSCHMVMFACGAVVSIKSSLADLHGMTGYVNNDCGHKFKTN